MTKVLVTMILGAVQDEAGDVNHEEDADDDGNDDPQRRARSRCQRQHAQLCHHA